MWIAGDFILRFGAEAIELRPSLKAAMRLHQGYHGLDQLAHAVTEGRMSALQDIVSEGSRRRKIPARVTVREVEAAKVPALEFINVLAGMDIAAKPPKGGKPGKAVSIEEWHAHLYRIGTGWLGWTPNETLEATPAQILGAYDGRIEMLQSIFGTSDNDIPSPSPEQLDAKVAAIFGEKPGRLYRRVDGKLQEVRQ